MTSRSMKRRLSDAEIARLLALDARARRLSNFARIFCLGETQDVPRELRRFVPPLLEFQAREPKP